MFVEPQPQALLSWVDLCQWCSMLPQLDCYQYPSSRSNESVSEASDAFYAVATGLDLHSGRNSAFHSSRS